MSWHEKRAKKRRYGSQGQQAQSKPKAPTYRVRVACIMAHRFSYRLEPERQEPSPSERHEGLPRVDARRMKNRIHRQFTRRGWCIHRALCDVCGRERAATKASIPLLYTPAGRTKQGGKGQASGAGCRVSGGRRYVVDGRWQAVGGRWEKPESRAPNRESRFSLWRRAALC